VVAAAYVTTAVALPLYSTVYQESHFYVLPVLPSDLGGSIPVRPAFQAAFFGLRALGAIQVLPLTIASLGGLAGPVFAGG